MGRVASMMDPPSRPTRPLVKADATGGRMVFTAKLGFKVPLPPAPATILEPVAPAEEPQEILEALQISDEPVQEVAAKGSEEPTEDEAPALSPIVFSPTPVLEPAETKATAPAPPPLPAPAPSVPAPPAPVAASHPLVTPINSRPVAAQTSSTGTNSKRPAVLQKRGGAPPAGQVQGFAPTRRRPGLTEPTLSQLAKQNPTKAYVPAVKKPEVVPPVKKPVVSTKMEELPKKAPVAPGRKLASSKPGPRHPAPIPEEVIRAAHVPLPPVTPEEVPLPPVQPDEVPLPPVRDDEVQLAPTVDQVDSHEAQIPATSATTPDLPSTVDKVDVYQSVLDEEEKDSPITATEATPRPAPRKSALLLDWDTSLVLAPLQTSAPTNQSASPATATNRTETQDLLDFDMSVVLPPDFTPMMALAPIPLTVLRDPVTIIQDEALSTPKFSNKLKAKAFGDDELHLPAPRVALAERELNIL